MSTYLQLCVDARRECLIPGTGPSAVTGQIGDLEKLVAWVAQSYTEIQQRYIQRWRWMRSTFTVNTVADTDTYAYGDCTDTRLSAPITRFSRWISFDDDGFANITRYLTSSGVSGEIAMSYLPWASFRAIYKRGTQSGLTGQPVHFTIDPQNKLVLGPNPSAIYTLNGEYQMSPQVLAADGDTPEMPVQFHPLIVYRTMEKYGAARGAGEIFNRGGYEGGKMMHALEMDQLPPISFGAPLA